MTQLDHLGTFNPEAIKETLAEVERQKASKRDYIFPAPRLSYTEAGTLALSGMKVFDVAGQTYTEWADAEKAADAAGERVHVQDVGELALRDKAEGQLAQRLGIPMTYVSRLRDAKHADLIAHNFTELLHRDDQKLMLRCLDGRVRAVLSSSYRILDNADLFYAAAETFQQCGAQLWKARLWDDGFELFGVAPHIAGEVKLDGTFDPGDGWQSRWAGDEGDVHNAAVRISNSETGQGGLHVSPAVMRKVCANFNVWGNAVSQIHLGRKRDEEGLIYSDDTQEAESKTVWLKVRDTIKTAFDPSRFETYLAALNKIKLQKLEEPTKAVQNVIRAYAINEDRKEAILEALFGSRDRSRFGLVQAITVQAHGLDKAGKHEQASVMERVGGELVTMPDKQFAALVAKD